MANTVFDELEELLARIAEAEEQERIVRMERANRTVNIVSWKMDEDPDPVEA